LETGGFLGMGRVLWFRLVDCNYFFNLHMLSNSKVCVMERDNDVCNTMAVSFLCLHLSHACNIGCIWQNNICYNSSYCFKNPCPLCEKKMKKLELITSDFDQHIVLIKIYQYLSGSNVSGLY